MVYFLVYFLPLIYVNTTKRNGFPLFTNFFKSKKKGKSEIALINTLGKSETSILETLRVRKRDPKGKWQT